MRTFIPLLRVVSIAALVLAAGCGGSDGTNGTNGNDGTSCTVTDNGDGTFTIDCDDGTSATVSDGTDGGQCTVVDNGDGTKTITCDDGTEVTVSDGTDGSDVTIVANESCVVCHSDGSIADVEAMHVGAIEKIDPTDDLEILGVDIDTSSGQVKMSINFRFEVGFFDAFGNRVDVNPFTPRSNPAQLEFIRFFVAKLVPGASGSPDTWDEYAAGERNVSGLVENPDGTYTYTFAGDFVADFDATATHRAGIQLYHLDGFKVINPLFDFRPDGGALRSHEVVNITSCNNCHGEFGIHGGGRVETGMCVMCHNENRPLVDLPVMVHKIHTAQMVDDHDFTEVTYPQDVRNCRTCHDGTDALTPEGDNWLNVPNRKACGACHADVNFDDGTNHVGGVQLTDAMCNVCHSPTAIETVHLTEDITPHNPSLPVGLSEIQYELVDARVSGTTLEVDFTITRDGTPLDILALPTDLTTSSRRPSFLTAWALPQGGIQAPADYNNLGNNGGMASSFNLGGLIDDGNVAASGTSGVFTATIAGAFPDGAAMRAVGMQGYFSQTLSGSDIARHTRSKVLPIPGDAVRREVVSMNKCLNCHESLQLHGGNRVDDPGICKMCHTPSLTSSGRAADPTTLPDATVAVLGDNPLVYPEESMNLKDLVHSAHGADVRQAAFEFVRNRNGGLYYNFAEITFPGILQNCETCHLPGTYGPELVDGVLPSTFVTTSGAGATRDDILSARDTVPNATDLASSPLAATCYGCHASQSVEAHIEANGGIIAEPRGAAGLNN